MNNKTFPCGLCGKDTLMITAKLCVDCWELTTRIHHKPELARKILADLEAKAK